MQEPVLPYNVLEKNLTKGNSGPKISKIAIMADFGSKHYLKDPAECFDNSSFES